MRAFIAGLSIIVVQWTAALAYAQNVAFAPAMNVPVALSPDSVVSADFNNDGHLDLAVTSTGSNVVTILLGDGTGAFPTRSDVGVASGPHGIVTADFDNNGNQDLAVAATDGTAVSVLLGDGAGGFTRTDRPVAGGSPWGIVA